MFLLHPLPGVFLLGMSRKGVEEEENSRWDLGVTIPARIRRLFQGIFPRRIRQSRGWGGLVVVPMGFSAGIGIGAPLDPPSPIPLSRPGHKFPAFFHPGATPAINSRSWPFPADSSSNPSKSRQGARNENHGPGGSGPGRTIPDFPRFGSFSRFFPGPRTAARGSGWIQGPGMGFLGWMRSAAPRERGLGVHSRPAFPPHILYPVSQIPHPYSHSYPTSPFLSCIPTPDPHPIISIPVPIPDSYPTSPSQSLSHNLHPISHIPYSHPHPNLHPIFPSHIPYPNPSPNPSPYPTSHNPHPAFSAHILIP